MDPEPMLAADYDELQTLWSQTPGITLRAVDDSRQGFERFLERNPGHNFVCRDQGRIVGALLCGHDGRKGFIYHAAVRPGHRRQGIGRRLADSAVGSLRQAGITKVAILVNADNQAARDFWAALGFATDPGLVYGLLPLDPRNT